MKAVHVVPHIDKEASGPSYSVPRLCQSLAACGATVELKCLAAREAVPGVQLEVYRQWPGFSRFAISTELPRALRQDARDARIIHNHSLWSMVNVAAGWVVPAGAAKLVVSPRGTLSARALKRRRLAKSGLWALQKRVLARADLLHATSEAEFADIRRLGFRTPVAVIPNGIDLPDNDQDARQHGTRTLLYLGRIHPIKGIDNLLHAWRQVAAKHPDWRLVIAGKGERAHVDAIRQLAASLELSRVAFPGPLYGEDKSHAYATADLFILPSHSENFGMVVAEALAHGCPAIVSQGAPWSGLERTGSGWWVNDDPGALSSALDGALGVSRDELTSMGGQGRRWMATDFSWPSVGQRMMTAYRWLLRGGELPPCIRVEHKATRERVT